MAEVSAEPTQQAYCRELRSEGIRLDYVAGVSAGALTELAPRMNEILGILERDRKNSQKITPNLQKLAERSLKKKDNTV